MANFDQVLFIQANLHRSKAATSLFSENFGRKSKDIGFVQEPYTGNRGEVIGINKRSCVVLQFADKSNPPRAVLVFRKGLLHLPITQFIKRDLVAALVDFDVAGISHKIVVASTYHDEDLDVVSDDLKNLSDLCRSKGYQLVFGGDMNAHNEIWGSDETNFRGEELLSFTISRSLNILNSGSKPTFDTVKRLRNGELRHYKSVIDLTICSRFMSQTVSDWRVEDEDTCSDHKYITFSLAARRQRFESYRDPRKTDWVTYESLLKSRIPGLDLNMRSTDDIDRVVDRLNVIILKAYQRTNVEQHFTTNHDNCWWNKSLERQRKEVRRLQNIAKRTGNWSDYKSSLNRYTMSIKKAKEESFQKTVEGIESVAATARFCKLMSRNHTNGIGTLRKGSVYTTTGKETLEFLAEIHFPNCQISDNVNQEDQYVGSSLVEDFSLSECLFSEHAIRWAIKGFNSDKIFPDFRSKSYLD